MDEHKQVVETLGLVEAVSKTALTSASVIAVVDAGDDQVEVRLKDTFHLLKAVGSTGSGDDQFNAPTHVRLDGNFIHVVDTGNSRVSRKSWGGVKHHAHATLAAMGILQPVNCLAIDSARGYYGRVDTQRDVYQNYHTEPYSAAGSTLTGGAGTIVGFDTDGVYAYLADSVGNTIQKRLLSDGSLVAENLTIPGTAIVTALTMDTEYVYVACCDGVTDCQVLALHKSDLMQAYSGTLTGKLDIYALSVDDTNIYFTCTTDNTLNRIAKALTGAITSVGGFTAVRGCSVVTPAYLAIPVEARTLAGVAVAGGAGADAAIGTLTVLSGTGVAGAVASGASLNPPLVSTAPAVCGAAGVDAAIGTAVASWGAGASCGCVGVAAALYASPTGTTSAGASVSGATCGTGTPGMTMTADTASIGTPTIRWGG